VFWLNIKLFIKKIIKMKNDLKNSWINSNNVCKRALSVFGHWMLGYFLVGIITMGIFMIFGGVAYVIDLFL